MATPIRVGGDGDLFKGDDAVITGQVTTPAGVPVDVTTWAVRFVVRRSPVAAVVIDKAATIDGVFSTTNNPQKLVVTLTDTDLNIASGVYECSFKRTDDGSEKILGWGPFHVQITTQT